MFLKQVYWITKTCPNSYESKIYKYVHYSDYKNFNEQDLKLELRGKLEVDVVDANY